MRNPPILLQIAIRNVVRNPRRSGLTILAIMMAVGLLIFARGATNGLHRLFMDRVVLGQTGALQVHKRGYADNIAKSPLELAFPVTEVLARAKTAAGVRAVAPRIVFPAMVSAGDNTLFSLVFAVDPKAEYEVCPEKKNEIGTGSLTNDGAVLSPDLQRQLGVSIASELTLLSTDADGVLNAALAKASGLLADNPAFSTDRKLLYLPLPLAQGLLRLEGRATELAISADEAEVDAVKQTLLAALGSEYEVQTWKELARFIVDEINNEEIALTFVIGVFASLAMFGILNTMLMSVLSRTREIGAMMALGTRRRSIILLIVIEATVLALIGVVVGVLFGLLLVVVTAAIGIPITPPGMSTPDYIRPVIGSVFIVRAAFAAVVCSVVASLYPARRAAKLSPIDALGTA